MRESTSQNSAQRRRSSPSTVSSYDTESDVELHKVILEQLKEASIGHLRNHPPRLCGDLTTFLAHVESVTFHGNSPACEVCGLGTSTKCGACGVAVHFFPRKGHQTDKHCFVEYHSDPCFGLARGDVKLIGEKQCDWKPATEVEKRRNAMHIKKLHAEEQQQE